MHMVALVELRAEAQMHWNQRALAMAAKSSDPNARNWDASLANNIGMTQHEGGDYAAALKSSRSRLRRASVSASRAGFGKRAGWSPGPFAR